MEQVDMEDVRRRVGEQIMSELAGKSYPEQLKILLGYLRNIGKSEFTNECIIRACKKHERTIMRELNMVFAELN